MIFNIIRSGRAVLHVTDLDRSRAFYEALGFIVTEADDENIFLRGLEEHNHHSLWLKKRMEAAVEVISYKVIADENLDDLEKLFLQQGKNVKWLKKGTQKAVGRTLRVQDKAGLPLEFYAEMETVDRLLQRYELYKGAKVQRIDHFNCMVANVEEAYNYYIDELGFACSEYTVDENEKIWAAWLHRKPSVHDIAFMNGCWTTVTSYWFLVKRSNEFNRGL